MGGRGRNLYLLSTFSECYSSSVMGQSGARLPWAESRLCQAKLCGLGKLINFSVLNLIIFERVIISQGDGE